MLKFKDIVRYICATVIYLYKYIRNLLKMNSVYDCFRPFLLVAGIFGLGGNTIREIEGVRSVRNSRFSLIIAVFISVFIMPAYSIWCFLVLFSGRPRPLVECIGLIIWLGTYVFVIPTAAVTCIRTHIYCKNFTRVLQILNNTDMMLKQENIQVNYWKIILKTILFGLISNNILKLNISVHVLSLYRNPVIFTVFIVKILLDIGCDIYFMWIILPLLIIRERFVGLNKLLLQNAQVPSIMQDDSLLRRISLARDIHEQLSEAIALFSDISRFIIIGVLVPGMLDSLFSALATAQSWNTLIIAGGDGNVTSASIKRLLTFAHIVIQPIMKIVILTAVCEGHKNNHRVLNARLRYLISREEDPRTVHQLQQYIWYIYDTPAGLVDFQLIDVDFALLFMVIDIIIQYLLLIWSYYRISVVGETM